MKEDRNKIKIICYVGAVLLLFVMSFLPLVSIVYGDESGQDDFILPEWGGGMVHSDPQMSDNIRLPVPTTNVGKVWYRRDLGGELFGTLGIGIAGNSKIAASTFNNYNILKHNNLIFYDYYGNHIWNDSQLNLLACSSTPMVDMNDQVIACDNKTIILVNASNHSNIHVEWTSPIPLGSFFQPFGTTPFSPNIVENRTIILPTSGGPLYAFDVKTGREIANLTFWDNSSIEPFYGIREMNLSDFMTIMSNPLNCPYHYNSSSQAVEWNSTVPYGIMPMTPIFYEGDIMFLSDHNGAVAAVDITTGSILTISSLGTPELVTDGKMYSTKNSACVQGNKVFVATQYKASGFYKWSNYSGRLYAVDVNPDAQNPSDILKVNWSYSFTGQSQASPTLINDTIYFDGYNGGTICLDPLQIEILISMQCIQTEQNDGTYPMII